MTLYRLVSVEGEATIDPATTEAYAFANAPRRPERAEAAIAPIGAFPGCRGAAVFADDAGASVVLYHFARAEDVDAFSSETFYHVLAMRTFD